VAIELIRSGEKNNENEKHWKRFSEDYKEWTGRCAVLNFQMTGKNVTPIKGANLYTFLYDTNELYHGNVIISTTATRIPSINTKKHGRPFSTLRRCVPDDDDLMLGQQEVSSQSSGSSSASMSEAGDQEEEKEEEEEEDDPLVEATSLRANAGGKKKRSLPSPAKSQASKKPKKLPPVEKAPVEKASAGAKVVLPQKRATRGKK
jgi:hypothetical protein